MSAYLHGDVLGGLQREDEASEQFKRGAQLEHGQPISLKITM